MLLPGAAFPDTVLGCGVIRMYYDVAAAQLLLES